MGPGSSACTSSGRPSRAISGMARRRSASVTCGNSSTPEGTRKHLNPRTPAAAMGSSSCDVAGHDAAPELDRDFAAPGGGPALRLQGGDRRRRRDRVERHVHERADAAGARGAGRGLEPLPVRAAGIVDVHVRVDEGGHQHEVAEVLDVGRNGCVVVVHGRDPAAFHAHHRGSLALRQDDASGLERSRSAAEKAGALAGFG